MRKERIEMKEDSDVHIYELTGKMKRERERE